MLCGYIFQVLDAGRNVGQSIATYILKNAHNQVPNIEFLIV